MLKIKEIVSEKEIKKIDEAVKQIYDVVYDNNYSVAYNLGFDTVSNLNGSGYENLIRIVDSLNDGGEQEAFASFILAKVLNEEQIKNLKIELWVNRNHYSGILYL